MSDWVYVAAAFTVVWGSLAVYALILARRVAQARELARRLQMDLTEERQMREQDAVACDIEPVP